MSSALPVPYSEIKMGYLSFTLSNKYIPQQKIMAKAVYHVPVCLLQAVDHFYQDRCLLNRMTLLYLKS